MSSTPTAPGLVPHMEVLTGMEVGPFQLAPGSGCPPGAGLSTMGSDCDIEPQIVLGITFVSHFHAWGRAWGGKLMAASFSTGDFPPAW